MPATILDDVIVPEVFLPYVIQRTMELSALFQSGIVAQVPELSVPSGGSEIQMPYWEDLAGDDQVLDTETDLTVGKISAEQDTATVLGRALVYGAADLAGALAGDDPMAAIGDLVAAKWGRRWQQVVINVLNGAMGASSMSGNVFDITALSGGAAVIDGESMVDAGGSLGDAETQLTAIAVHSATERVLRKQGLIDYLPDEEGKPTIAVYQGKRVVVDDGMPVGSGGTAGEYTSFMFGAGAIGYGEGTPKVPVETERNGLVNGGEEYLIQRRHVVLHPRGIAWGGTPAKNTASNAELATTTNWTRKWENKAIRIVAFKHRLAAA